MIYILIYIFLLLLLYRPRRKKSNKKRKSKNGTQNNIDGMIKPSFSKIYSGMYSGDQYGHGVSASPIGGENMWENVATSLVARQTKNTQSSADDAFGFSFGGAEDAFLSVQPRTPGQYGIMTPGKRQQTPVEHLRVPHSVQKMNSRGTPNFAFTPGAASSSTAHGLQSASQHIGAAKGFSHSSVSSSSSSSSLQSASSRKRKRGRTMVLGGTAATHTPSGASKTGW